MSRLRKFIFWRMAPYIVRLMAINNEARAHPENESLKGLFWERIELQDRLRIWTMIYRWLGGFRK